jgi:hypothetical protein
MFVRSILIISLSAVAWPLQAAEKVLTFSGYKENETPSGFRSVVSGSGKPGEWKVLLDDAPSMFAPISPKAPATSKRAVLGQLSRDKTDEHFPMFVYDEESFDDFLLTTQFKIVDGVEEQMAGIAFRVRDENNYYYVRASALGNSFVFYKLVNGVRSPPVAARLPIPKGVWHDLRLECKGTKILVQLDGKAILPDMDDNSFMSGKIGFWTKSDSVSYFAETRIVYQPKEIFAQTLLNDAIKNYPRLLGLKMFAALPGKTNVQLIASLDRAEIGGPAETAEKETLAKNIIYYGKIKDQIIVTLPLHDSNGDTIAAVKVYMKSFPGQTEKNALVRALPIVKDMEKRVQSLATLTQ